VSSEHDEQADQRRPISQTLLCASRPFRTLKCFSGPTPEDKKLAEEANVNLQLALGYWLQGKEFTLAHVFKFPAMPEMRLSLAKYLTGEFPALVQGWKEGTGSDKLKVAKLNKFEGGLEGM